jgi:4-diphosphocytidyl-2-C-methyl-D-erythritol kinase
VLAGLSDLWGAMPDEGLAQLAASLGSDVPLFLGPATSRMAGRGEILAPIEIHPFVALLILPACECSTAAVYRAFDEERAVSKLMLTGEQLDPKTLLRPPSHWRGLLRNDLARAARNVSPELAGLWDALSAAIPVPVCLTGSGSALFFLCDDEAEAASLLPGIRRLCDCVVVRNNPW